MSKKRNTKFIALSIATLSFFVVWYITTFIFSWHGNRIEIVTIGKEKFRAEVVSSEVKMQKGLGGRKDLCDSCGMFFKFPKAGKYSFWMKDMRFPLDIIWMKNGEVVHVEKNVLEKFLGTLSPQVDADSVLEINAGNVDKLGLEIGNKILRTQ